MQFGETTQAKRSRSIRLCVNRTKQKAEDVSSTTCTVVITITRKQQHRPACAAVCNKIELRRKEEREFSYSVHEVHFLPMTSITRGMLAEFGTGQRVTSITLMIVRQEEEEESCVSTLKILFENYLKKNPSKKKTAEKERRTDT